MQELCLYLERRKKKKATILNLYNNLNLMQHVTGILWNVGVHLYFNILGYVQISKPIMVYLHSQKKKFMVYLKKSLIFLFIQNNIIIM